MKRDVGDTEEDGRSLIDLMLFHGPRMRPGGLGGPQDQAI